MNKRLLSMICCSALALTTGSFAHNTSRTNRQTQTTATTQAGQNPDGPWTVIEYPANKEVVVELTPASEAAGAKGTAKVMRTSNHTTVKIDLSGLGRVTALNLYAVDPMSKITLLGPVTINNGIVVQEFKTPLYKFMLVLSPESNLTTLVATTPVVFRSAVPQGFAVVPLHSLDREPDGSLVVAGITQGQTTAYNVPMLGIPSMSRGENKDVRLNFSGSLSGSRANVFIDSRKDGPTTIKIRLNECARDVAGKHYIAWAVSPDNKFVKLGKLVCNNRASIMETETTLEDFGILITLEDDSNLGTPNGTVVATAYLN